MSVPHCVALLGGSFDPPHVGHLLMATWAICQQDVDEVWCVPTYRHPFGKPLTDFAIRHEMLTLAIAHLGPSVRVESIESELEGPSYSVATVTALSERHPDVRWRWVGGADTWNARSTWRDWERLETMIEPLIVGREGEPAPEPFANAPVLPDISSSAIRARVAAGEDIRGLVPQEVEAVIRRRDLYR